MAARNPFGFPVSGDVEGQLAAVLGSHTERVLAELDDRLLGGFDDVPWDELSEGYRTVKPFVRMPRSETRYTGLMGREHTQSLQKGYLDLGLVDPQNAKMLKAYKLGEWLLGAMKQEGVAYIRDPEGVLKKSGVSVNDIADGIKQDLESYYAERSEVADTPEERDALERIFKAIKGARITFSSVKGRQGDPGYKVVMKPSPGQIQAMGLQREDLDELAMTKEITVKLADKKVTVRIPKGLRAGTREFMKGIRFAERIEVPIDKNAQNNEKKLENFTPKTPPHIIQYTVGQAIPKPPALRLAEKLTSMAMTKAGIKKQAFQTQGAEDLYMAAAKSNAPFWAGVMAAGRALFQVADTFDKEYHEQEWKRLSEKALETIGYPGQNEKSAFKKKLAIRKARARIFGEQKEQTINYKAINATLAQAIGNLQQSELESVQESRPGPHWNPWPQKKTKSNEFVKSLEDLARVNSSAGMWSKETADIVANVAWAMKKGDKAKVKKLWKLLAGQSDVSAGLVNEIDHWLKGWMESTECGEGLLDEAARTWSANGYLEIKTDERLNPKDVKAIKRYVMRWANGGERAGPSMLPKGRRWKATDVLLTGGKLMVAFETDGEPTRKTVNDIENEVIGSDGLGGILWQFAVHDVASEEGDRLQMKLYGGNYQTDDRMAPLRVVGMDISSNVGVQESLDEAMAVGVTSYDVPSPKGLEPRGSATDAGAMLAFSNAFAKLLKKLKKDVPGVKRVYGGYKGTGRQKSRRQVWVDFKEGMTDRNLDLWVSGSGVTLGGVLGPVSKAIVSAIDRTPDEVYRDVVKELKKRAGHSVERVQGSGTPLEEAKVRRRRKVTAKKARRRQRAVAAGVKPDKPDKVYKSSVSMSTPEGFFDRMVTYKLPMADSKAPPGAERALLILDDSEVPDGAYNEIVGYLGRPDSERQRSGGFEAGFANAPEWTAYDTDGRVVASKMMFADAVSDLLLFYNDEIEAAALDYLKAPSRGKFASAFSR